MKIYAALRSLLRGHAKRLMFSLWSRQIKRSLFNKLEGGDVVHIAFFVRESEKWNMQGLYEKLLESEFFCPRLFVFPYIMQNGEIDLREYRRNLEYFCEIDPFAVGVLTDSSAKTKNFRDLMKESPADIIFYQQPWIQRLNFFSASQVALNAYTPYYYMLTYLPRIDYSKKGFHDYIHIYFCQSQSHKKLHARVRPDHASRLKVAGYPKFDGIQEKYEGYESPSMGRKKKKTKVIYAPHHSISQRSALRMSTFDWNHIELLDLARRHTDIEWVYRPHPGLKYAVEKYSLMSKESYLEYEGEWDGLPNATVSRGGDYMGLFYESNALITDCVSFRAEYLLTGHPLIRLVSRNNPVEDNEIGEMVNSCCYSVETVEDIEAVFQQVVLHGDDPLQERRLIVRRELFPRYQDSAIEMMTGIFDYCEVSSSSQVRLLKSLCLSAARTDRRGPYPK